MQEACLRLMRKKLFVSLAMEGKFATDGLQAIDEGDDILMAMARELVTEKGIGENADAVWQLQRQQAEVFGVRPWRHRHRKWRQDLRSWMYQKLSFHGHRRSQHW
jgi:hypothetical protein